MFFPSCNGILQFLKEVDSRQRTDYAAVGVDGRSLLRVKRCWVGGVLHQKDRDLSTHHFLVSTIKTGRTETDYVTEISKNTLFTKSTWLKSSFRALSNGVHISKIKNFHFSVT